MAQELARALTKTPSASADETHNLRIIEAVLFASPVSLHESKLAAHLPEGTDIPALLLQLQDTYASRGIHLKKVAGRWMFRTADDLGHLLQREVHDERRLSKAALETLSIIAYHQPVTRAEIEEVRGVSTSSGTLDILLETNWVRMRGRRRAPGRPVTYGTTDIFLEHFGLDTIRDLPGLSELKGAGLLDPTMPANFDMPQPTDVAELLPDELPLDDEDAEDDDLFGETDDPDEADDDGGTEDRSVAPERARTTDMSQDQSEPIPSAAKDADRPTETES
ncbi:MAG: SMC-Scp complex subunit ScpB [Pseudomonadota bacterium]